MGQDTESKIGAYLASQELSQFTDDEEDGDHRPSFADLDVPLATTDDEVSLELVTFLKCWRPHRPSQGNTSQPGRSQEEPVSRKLKDSLPVLIREQTSSRGCRGSQRLST